MNDFSIKNLIFQDKEIEIIDINQSKNNDQDKITITFKSINPNHPEYCEKCGCVNFGSKDYYIRKIKHVNLSNDIECELLFKQKRFKCLECNKTCNEVSDIVEKSARVSTGLKEKIKKECSYGRTIIDVAYTNNVSDTTVNNIYNENVEIERNPLSEIICIDEFKGPAIEGKLIFIIVNPIDNEVIDILPSRKQTYLIDYFKKIDIKEREKVKYVVTDLCPVYLYIIKSMFPKAKHIADRFHWIRLITNAVQQIRIIAMKFHLKVAIKEVGSENKNKLKYNDHFIMYKILKEHYRLLNFNTKHGPQEYLRSQGHIYGDNYKYINQEILEKILNNDNDLLEAYEYLQELYYIVYNVQYKEARKELTRWCEKIKKSANKNIYPLKKVIDTIYEWENQIVNSFIISDELGGNITNGIVEAKNNVAKTIIKNSYGKNDFKKFRKQFLESERIRKERK